MIKILKRLWVIYYYLWFAMVFFAFYIPFLFLLSNEKYYLLANRLRGLGSQILFLMSGVFWEISFEKKLSKKQTYIFCSNHASHLDIPLFILILRGFNFAFRTL